MFATRGFQTLFVSAPAEEGQAQAHVLQASASAVSYQPPPAAPPSPPTRRTSGTRATPASTLRLIQRAVLSP